MSNVKNIATTNRVNTVSNWMSFARILLTPFAIYCMYTGRWQFVIGICVLMAVTDFLDGFLARALDQVSSLGKVLDPIADKISISTLMIAFAFIRKLDPVFLGLIGLIFVRDIITIYLAARIINREGFIPPPSIFGKLAVFALAITFFLIISGVTERYSFIGFLFAGISYALIIVTAVHYLITYVCKRNP
ncbi:MAG: CDP-alcohol phosphatidyltransferase family protein [Spirochaetota bacterium]